LFLIVFRLSIFGTLLLCLLLFSESLKSEFLKFFCLLMFLFSIVCICLYIGTNACPLLVPFLGRLCTTTCPELVPNLVILILLPLYWLCDGKYTIYFQ